MPHRDIDVRGYLFAHDATRTEEVTIPFSYTIPAGDWCVTITYAGIPITVNDAEFASALRAAHLDSGATATADAASDVA